MSLMTQRRSVRTRARQVRPLLDGLEDRILLYATTGNRFQTGAEIRYSIVPDGTDLGGVKSNLYAAFNKVIGPNLWQTAIFDAAASWATYASLNMVYVGDNGDPIGSGNYQQGNPNFGDIRIGGFVQPNTNILAFALAPPPANGDSSSGDIVFNTGQYFSVGASNDLETVMLHEFGHALGLGHSTNSTAVMYATYTGMKDVLTQDDVNGIQAVWGPRTEDPIAQHNHNFSVGQAADLTGYTTQYNQVIIPNLNVANPTETYWFKIYTPANESSNLGLVVQSQGLSSLSPRVAIFDANGNGLTQASASATTYGAFVGTQITNAQPHTWYYLRVSGSNTGASGAGSYALFVNMGTAALSPVPPPNTVVGIQPSQGGGAMADTSASRAGGAAHDPRYDLNHVGKLRAVGDDLTVSPSLKQQIPRVAHVTTHQARNAQAHPTSRLASRRLARH